MLVDCPLCGKKHNLPEPEHSCDCGHSFKYILANPSIDASDTYVRRQTTTLMELRLSGLVDTCRLIHSTRDHNELLLEIVRRTTLMLNAEASTVALCDEETGELVFHSVTGNKSNDLSEFRLAKGEGIAGECVQNKSPVVVNNTKVDDRFSDRADTMSGFSTRSLLCVPLLVEQECIGALEVVNKICDSGFDADDLVLAEAVAAQVAVAIHNNRLTEAAIKSERLAAIGLAITGVAHCVKNMLNGLQGGLFILKQSIEAANIEMSDQGPEMLERNLDRLTGLVYDMLAYSKDREPEYRSEDLNALVQSVEELMQAKAKERKTALRFKPCESLPPISIDGKGIYRCVLNLVSNALDACSEEGAGVDIRVLPTDDDSFVTIEVTDEGHGMDESTLNSIFQPFFSSKGSKGTGLGLSVTEKIIKEHGGHIEVVSTPGKGTTFLIRLPT